MIGDASRRSADAVVSEYLFETQTSSHEVDGDLFDAIVYSRYAEEQITGEGMMRQLIAAEFSEGHGRSDRNFGDYKFRRGG